ncbi:MAG: hypothetical protein QM586_11995 [Xenophilus sp.]
MEKAAGIGARDVRSLTDAQLLAELAALGVHLGSVMDEGGADVLAMAQRMGLVRPAQI